MLLLLRRLETGCQQLVAKKQAAEQIGEAIWNAIPFEKLQKLADMLAVIPSDIQETQLYADALRLSRLDLHYEDIDDWLDLFQMHSSRDAKKALAGLTFPTNAVEEYVKWIICNSRIPKREKTPVLLAHIEPLFYKAIGKTKMSRTPVKVIAKVTASK